MRPCGKNKRDKAYWLPLQWFKKQSKKLGRQIRKPQPDWRVSSHPVAWSTTAPRWNGQTSSTRSGLASSAPANSSQPPHPLHLRPGRAAALAQGGRYSLTGYGPTIIICSGAAAKPAIRPHSRRGAPAEKEGTACMPSWHTSSKQGELGVWLVLVVNGREALETHSFQVVLEFIERPADSAQLQRGGELGWTLQEVERRANPATKQTRQSLLASPPMVQEANQEATWSRQGYGGVRARNTYIFEVLGWTLQEVERQHWADLLAAVPREHEESKQFLENMENQSGSFEKM